MAPCNRCGRLISCSCATDVAPQLGSNTSVAALEAIPADVDAPAVRSSASVVSSGQVSTYRTYSEWAYERANYTPPVIGETPQHVGLTRLAIKWLMAYLASVRSA